MGWGGIALPSLGPTTTLLLSSAPPKKKQSALLMCFSVGEFFYCFMYDFVLVESEDEDSVECWLRCIPC